MAIEGEATQIAGVGYQTLSAQAEIKKKNERMRDNAVQAYMDILPLIKKPKDYISSCEPEEV